MFTDLQKLIAKKTKVQVILEQEITSYNNVKEAQKNLLLISLISGASGNCLRQVTRTDVTNKEFEAIKQAQKKFEDIFYQLEKGLTIPLDNLVYPETHTFH